ncbi:MAG TPA: hypothetical protein P5528_02965 [Steroidobacteraceae bacterium]|nr:hypothetical protein [Steroidobacteraceae bacterium]HRX88384.1 hypothetical protein [Steroidobacteraceae bacterium]
MSHRTLRGKLGYFHNRLGDIGREWFTVTVMPDGCRTLRAHCEMDDDVVLRDVTYTVDAGWRPLDAFIRLSVQNRFVGSSWFRFAGCSVECEGNTAAEGRFAQRIELPAPAVRFGTHSLITDGWHGALWRADGPPIQSIPQQPASSHAANGATGPMILLGDSTLKRVGEERLRVPAGDFATEHFEILLVDFPSLHFWVTGPDVQLVRIEWQHLDAYYELLEYEETGNAHGS